MLWSRLIGAGGVIGSIEYIGNNTASPGGVSASYTFTGESIGAANDNRWVVVIAHYDGGGITTNITDVSIAGSSGTEAAGADSGADDTGIGIWYRKVTSGTTADITITVGGTFADDFGIGVYRVLTRNSAPLVDSATAEDASAASLGSNENRNAVIAGITTQNGTTAPSIAGEATQDYGVDFGTSDYIRGFHGVAGTGTQSITGVAEGNYYKQSIASFKLY